MHDIEAVISGRVQNVMFRDFVQRNARGLRLTGYVENQTDGTVHVVARGPEDALTKLVSLLHKGPYFARVDDVSVLWSDPSAETFDGFVIRY